MLVAAEGPTWRCPLRQPLSQGTATARCIPRLTGAGRQARAVEAERPEERAHHDLVLPLASAPCAACRAGLLGRDIRRGLLGDQGLLHAGENSLALRQAQA